MTTVLDIQFRFLPRITFLVVPTDQIKINFIHRTPQTFVWKPQPHLSMLLGDLQIIKECEMWFYQWFEPFSLMQKLLEYLICLKLLRRLLFYSPFFFLFYFHPKTYCLIARVTIEVKKNNNK